MKTTKSVIHSIQRNLFVDSGLILTEGIDIILLVSDIQKLKETENIGNLEFVLFLDDYLILSKCIVRYMKLPLTAPSNTHVCIFNYYNIYLSKGASCNIAGDGPPKPSKQWNSFVKSGIILSTDNRNVFTGMLNDGDGDCFYYSVLQLKDLHSINIVTVADLRFAIWYFILHHEYQLCRLIYDAFRAIDDNDTYEEFIEAIKKPRNWACYKTIIITSIFLQTDIIVVTNELNPDGTMFTGLFNTSTAFNERLKNKTNLIPPNYERIYIYQHLYNKPLEPAPILHLNHFCALRRRPRKPDDFIVSFDESIKEKAYIVNNGIIDTEKTKKKCRC